MAKIQPIFATAAVLALAALSAAQGPKPFKVMVGDPAPKLAVSKWVKGEPVKEFKKGEVYVVEFWATWCGPCKVSIPHLTDLQKKYGDKVKFVGVSIWESDPKEVEPFVTSMGEKMDYRVAMDKLPAPDADGNDGEMAKTWMQAAGQNGIPSAFIIDKDGKVAWIGHPMAMDEPLDKVVKGTWNTKSHQDEQKVVMEARAKQQAIVDDYRKAIADKNFDAALKIAEDAIAAGQVPAGYSLKLGVLVSHKKDYPAALTFIESLIGQEDTRAMASMWKWNLLLVDMKDYEKASAWGRSLIESPMAEDWNFLNSIAWMIVDPQGKVEKKDLDLAMAAAEKSVAIARNHYNVDTLARIYFLKGDKAKAIELQKEAVQLAPDGEKPEIEKTLKEYESA